MMMISASVPPQYCISPLFAVPPVAWGSPVARQGQEPWQSPVQGQGQWYWQRVREQSAKKAWNARRVSSFSSPFSEKNDIALAKCWVCGCCIGPGFHEDQAYLRHIENEFSYDKSDNYVECKNVHIICCGTCARSRGVTEHALLFDQTLWESPVLLKDETQTSVEESAQGWGVNVPFDDWFDPSTYSANEHKHLVLEFGFFLHLVVLPLLKQNIKKKAYDMRMRLILRMLVHRWIGMEYIPRYAEPVRQPKGKSPAASQKQPQPESNRVYPTPELKRSSFGFNRSMPVPAQKSTTMSMPAIMKAKVS